MSTKPNNAVVVDTCTKRLLALKSYVGNKGQIGMNGSKSKISDVIAIFQNCLDSRAALSAKRSEVKVALAAKQSAETARSKADKALKAWVITEYGLESQQALDFGYATPKVATRKASDKARAAELAKATRKARNTMGKKQRLSIKGTLPAPTAPADPATNTPAGASPAGQPAVVVVQATTPQQQPQMLNGAPAPATSANGASGH